MGKERMRDYPSSVDRRASLFTITLGLHGFAHLHHSAHTKNTNGQGNIFVDTNRFGSSSLGFDCETVVE